jgi:hypothetical protein
MLTLFRTKMSKKRKTKEEIVAEYLTGNYTYRELGLKYDIPFRSNFFISCIKKGCLSILRQPFYCIYQAKVFSLFIRRYH